MQAAPTAGAPPGRAQERSVGCRAASTATWRGPMWPGDFPLSKGTQPVRAPDLGCRLGCRWRDEAHATRRSPSGGLRPSPVRCPRASYRLRPRRGRKGPPPSHAPGHGSLSLRYSRGRRRLRPSPAGVLAWQREENTVRGWDGWRRAAAVARPAPRTAGNGLQPAHPLPRLAAPEDEMKAPRLGRLPVLGPHVGP